MKNKEIFLFVFALICFELGSIGVVSMQTAIDQQDVSWLNFQKTNNKFTLSNPLNKVQIQFQNGQDEMAADSIQITENGYWKSQYRGAENSDKINVIGKRQQVLIEIDQSSNKKPVKFTINTQKDSEQRNLYLSIQTLQKIAFKPLAQICQKNSNSFECKFQKASRVYILYKTNQNFNILKSFKDQIQPSSSIIQALGVKKQAGQNFAKQMMTQTLSALCVEKSQYEGYQFYGLCSNSNSEYIDRHYSPLVIDVLFKYRQSLAVWLVQNFLNLLQQKLFYSIQGREWIAVPQHTQVFLTYLKHINYDKNLKIQEIIEKINHVINVQNGLINSLLLSEVNHLSEEINYRENNKVHPTIMKMFTQAWKSDLPRARMSSIYAESFTNDFFYHQKNQKLDSSVGKMMWLIKLINQHTKVITTYGDSFQKQSLEQLLSLSKVVHGFVLDDPRAKQGIFSSIIVTEKIRVYSRSLGYESLLPFTYEISPVFPTNTIFNLTTQIGLSSMPLNHEKVRQSYNFRGNVNLYFNYKILFNMLQRSLENNKYRPFSTGIKTIIRSIQGKILETYNQNDSKSNPNFYTSWTPKGRGVSSERYLAILNIAFMKDLSLGNQNVNSQNTQGHKASEKSE